MSGVLRGKSEEMLFYDVHLSDARYTLCDKTANAICARYGTGGGNTPIIVHRNVVKKQPAYSAIVRCGSAKSKDGKSAGKGALVREERTGALAATKQQMLFQSTGEDHQYVVRRLMPKECARLMGFPPDYCDGVPHSESAEYKLWGNGITLCSLDFLWNAVRVMKERAKEDDADK